MSTKEIVSGLLERLPNDVSLQEVVREIECNVSASTKALFPRPFGLCQGEFVVPDDFDAPLSADILADFEGK